MAKKRSKLTANKLKTSTNISITFDFETNDITFKLFVNGVLCRD
uniref:Uncharacterized protein n=1 Tax=Daphnia galeata TaxID=27404 RepID=A0A8J2S0G0_9CRUS|nr:unnamed protein product [Daphnia galeata]